MWEMMLTTLQKARKEYRCGAADWIDNAELGEEDYKPEDWAIIQNARKEGFKILKGTKYIKIKGMYDGEFSVFRARPELNDICLKYDLYPDL